MNYEMRPPPSSHRHPPHMTADTGVFRSSTGLFLRKALIPGNPLYTAFYAKLTHITQPPQRSGGGVGCGGGKFCGCRSRNAAHPRRPRAEHVRAHVRKHLKAKSRDPSVSLAKPNLISLGARGVASFIRLQNRRPACHFVRHALAKSATCSFPRQKVAILNESLAPSLLPLRWPHTLPWLWLQCSRLTCMPTFALPNSNISKHKAFAVDLSVRLPGHSWALVYECCSFIICVMVRLDSKSGCVLKLLLFIHPGVWWTHASIFSVGNHDLCMIIIF